MKKSILFFVSILLLNSGLSMAQTKKELKLQKSQEEYAVTKNIIENGSFIFVATSANTQKGRRIDLMTNPNSLIIDLDKTIGDLPFFGGSQLSHYESGGGIKFESLDTAISVDYNDDKRKITIKFDVKAKSESLKIILTITSDGTTSVNVTSTHRDFISYRGATTELKK